MPVADRDEGPHKAAPVRRRVPPAGHLPRATTVPPPAPRPFHAGRPIRKPPADGARRRARLPARRSLPLAMPKLFASPSAKASPSTPA